MAGSTATVTRRAGSEDPIDFTLRHDSDGDGVIDAPISLTNVQSVRLVLKRYDGVVKVLATTDVNPMLSIVNAAQGMVRLSPTPTFWQNSDRQYHGYFVIVDATGKDIPVAEDAEVVIIVRPSFEES
jgi:hypothetical protein